jgi:hypothetical protein
MQWYFLFFGLVGGSLFGAVQQAILFETCPDMLAVFTGAKDTLMI